MPLTPDPYEIENAPDHAGATADVIEGKPIATDPQEGNES
ncbi:MAG: hypothetical protein ACJA07_004798 [Rhodococcus sp. (in: high G+C Gram-positive bacteria)]|jgi:hypothetical protein